MLYSVSYDFSGAQDERQALEQALIGIGQSVRCLESTWLLISDESASQIRQKLEASVTSTLFCLITEIPGKNNAWSLDAARGVKSWRIANTIEMC